MPLVSPGYVWLAVVRVLSTLFYQTGYIHPDEFFQTTEIITGDVFGVVHARSWEFNKEFPVRSIGLLYGIFGLPLYTAQWIFKLYKIPWNPFTLLCVFRLVTCAISFITDYSLYKICKILKLKANRYLILLSSSYVILVYSTKTFTNSLELALVSLLLWKVVDSMIISEKVLIAEKKVRDMYGPCSLTTERVSMSRKLRKLPSHNYSHCFEIGTILAIGTFNRPTFILFAVTPIFYWLSRGFSKNYDNFVRIFNIRFLLLLLCTLPGVILFILIDSFYFEHITETETSLVITPLNFIKYNMKPSNLAKHGIHFRVTHAIVNMPLLFNVLVVIFLERLQLNNLVEIIKNHHYHLLPNIHHVNTFMMANVIIPLLLLSMFPHQEPRFLLPLLLPIVLTTTKVFTSNHNNYMRHIRFAWAVSNIIGIAFYGFLHQAGVTPMISHLFQDIKNISNVHIIHSHTYSIPVGLLMVPQLKESLSYSYMDQRRIKVYDLGSSLNPDELYNSIINVYKNITEGIITDDPVVYLALSGPLSKHFELIGNTSGLTYTKEMFFPHISMELMVYYLTFLIDLLYYDKNKSYLTSFMEFSDIFSLVLYKITINTE